MYPVLFTAGGVAVPTYALVAALAVAAGLGLAMREARLAGEDPQRILDLAFFGVLAAVVGAKAAWVLEHLDAYRTAGPGAWLRPWEGGFSAWGGAAAALAVAAVYLWRHRLPVARLADLAAPGIVAAAAIADAGCLAAGC
ncbi:MAG TPA: prolipoprotein diacylglyceryl transferase family protein, partial [Thermodesulfobacteriota bacterium]|nr:prolipoprotein diacylglyceryl transferase family protein [Thermodesulfobacteriota bacterium]